MKARDSRNPGWRVTSTPVVHGVDDAAAGNGHFRVLVSVRSDMVMRGICAMLGSIPEAWRVRTCADIDEIPVLLEGREFDVLIVSAPQSVGVLEKIVAVAEENDVRVVVLLDSLDEGIASALGQLPVDGFLLEEEVTEYSLRASLASLACGEMAMPSRLARTLLTHIRTLRQAESQRTFLLTPREQQALSLLADGMSNKQIARRLGISEHGAKRHVANVLAKLNCPNRTLAVALAMRYGLLGQPDEDPSPARGATPARPARRPVRRG